MDKELHNFISKVRQWLFNVEAGLSLGNISMSQEDIHNSMKKLDTYCSEAYNKYGYILENNLEEFSRVSEQYKKYVNSPK